MHQGSATALAADSSRPVRRLPIAPELTEEDQQSVENVAVIMEFLVGANGSDTFREVRPPAPTSLWRARTTSSHLPAKPWGECYNCK